MVPRVGLALLTAIALRGCIHYEFEHEFWLHVDGSGTVNVTGRPGLWTAFKSLPLDERDPEAMKRAVRALFETSGLEVRRVTVVRRRGHRYLFVAADFKDVNRISYTPAFPDLRVGLRHEAGLLQLDGSWQRPLEALAGESDGQGLVAVRFHLPSKVYGHRNAFAGVERGNIVGWRETVAEGLAGRPLEVGAQMDRRSILLSTITLFATAVVVALAILAVIVFWIVRKGRAAS